MARISIQQAAPDFELADFTGKPFTLSALQGGKNVLLVFNRGFA